MPVNPKSGVAPQPAASGGSTAAPSGPAPAQPAAAADTPESNLLALLAQDLAEPAVAPNPNPPGQVSTETPAPGAPPADAPEPPATPTPPGEDTTSSEISNLESEIPGGPADEPTSPKTPETETPGTSPDTTPKAEKRIRDLARKLEQTQNQLANALEILNKQTGQPAGTAQPKVPPGSSEVEILFDPQELHRKAREATLAVKSADRLLSMISIDPQHVETKLRAAMGDKAPQEMTAKDMADILWDTKESAQRTIDSVPRRMDFLQRYYQNLKVTHAEFPWLNDPADERRALAQIEFNSDPRWRQDPDADAKIAAIVEHRYAKEQKARKANGQPAAAAAGAGTGVVAVRPTAGTATTAARPAASGPRSASSTAAPPPRAATEADARLKAALDKAKNGSSAGLVEALAQTNWAR